LKLLSLLIGKIMHILNNFLTLKVISSGQYSIINVYRLKITSKTVELNMSKFELKKTSNLTIDKICPLPIWLYCTALQYHSSPQWDRG